jgi:hypothetical protein|eukprot:COSAG02_NODE_4798_length_4965_cov_8.333950_5_plen_104_part_00
MGLSLILNVFLAVDSANLLPGSFAVGVDAYWSSALVNLLYVAVALVLSTIKIIGTFFSGAGDQQAESAGSAASTSIYGQTQQHENDAESTEVARLLPTIDKGK